MICTAERHVWQWAQLHGNIPYPAPPGLRCQCGAITPEDIDPIRVLEAARADLAAEVSRLTKLAGQHASVAEVAMGEAERRRAENKRLTAERDRLVRALYMVGDVERLAQCPCCLAERTNGEWHADDCAFGAGVERRMG